MSHAAAAPASASFVNDVYATEVTDRPTTAAHQTALEMLVNDHPGAATTFGHYLNTLAGCFDRFALQAPANGLLDGKVLASIEAFAPYLAEYRAVLTALARRTDAHAFAGQIVVFFGALQSFKNPPADDRQQCVLWVDAYRFILRELFLTTVAILIRHERFEAVAVLLRERYATAADGCQARASFVVLDGYTKTLDEFRNRRLQLHRLSVSSDLMRERIDPAHFSFEEVMQADFLLCLRSLICEENFFVRWFPRSLVYAERFTATGFDLFVTTAGDERCAPLATLFDVTNREDLVRRFEDVREAWCLDNWELAGCPLDFRGYMGLRNPALTR